MSSESAGVTVSRPVIGRAETRVDIERLLDDASQGHGGLLVLVGDEGIGKTTLIRFAVELSRKKGFRASQARAVPSESPRPFALLGELLTPLQTVPATGAATSSHAAPFSLLLAPLENEPFTPDESTSGLFDARSAEEENRRLLAAITALPRRTDRRQFLLLDRLVENLTELAADQPILLAIDDLQFVDDSSLEFLAELNGRLGRQRVAVVVTTLPTARISPSLQLFLESLRNHGSPRWREIPCLSPTELGQYLSWLSAGRVVSPEEAGRWFRQTNGNPLVLEQFVRGQAGGAAAAEETPRRLEEAHRARFRALPEEVRRILCYGAIIGKEFRFDTLARAVGQEPDRISSALDSLVGEGLLRETSPETFEFVREALRQEAYAGLTESHRRILHRKVAEALEEGGRGGAPPVFELARHFYLARDWARALDYSRRAGELAAKSYAYREARLHLERARECARHLPVRDVATEFRLDTERGRVLVEMGEVRPAIEILAEALGRARDDPRLSAELPVATLWLAQAHSTLWEHARARELAASALTLFERNRDPMGTAMAHRILGVADWDTGNFGAAEQHHREAVETAARAGNRYLEAHARIDLANVLLYGGPGRAAEALALYDRAEELFRETSDPASSARVLMNRSILLHKQGEKARAFADIEAATRAAEQSGSLLWRVYTCLNEADFRAEDGETSAVRPLLEKARGLNERLQDRLSDQQIAMIDGSVCEQEGRFAEARGRYQDGLRLAQELEMVPDTIEMHYRIARLALKQGDRAEARQHLDRAYAANIDPIRKDLLPKVEMLRRELEGT